MTTSRFDQADQLGAALAVLTAQVKGHPTVAEVEGLYADKPAGYLTGGLLGLARIQLDLLAVALSKAARLSDPPGERVTPEQALEKLGEVIAQQGQAQG